MAKDIDNAKRGTQYTADPMDLTLIWEDAKDSRIGPKDLILSDWPQHAFVRAAFDKSIAEPTDQSHVHGMITKLDGGGIVGVLQNVIVRVVPCPKDIAKRLKVAEGEDLLIVTAGRSRTKEAREGNNQLAQSGASLKIRVPFDTRKMTDQTAELVKGIENLHRKILKPTEIAHYIQTAEDAKTPRDKIMMEVGSALRGEALQSWAAVETYKALGKLSPTLQAMVDAGTVPLKAAVEIGKKHKLHEDQDKAAEALSQIAAQNSKGKVKAVAEGKQDGDSKPEPQTKIPSRDRLQGIADKLWQDQQSKDSKAPQGIAYLTLQWVLSGAKPETAPDFLKAVAQSSKGKGSKTAAPVDPEQVEKTRKVRDALISQRFPIRFVLIKSLERWETEGKSDQPDEFCKGQPWYPRLHEAFTTAYNAIVQATPADKDCPTREAFFAKWVDTVKE